MTEYAAIAATLRQVLKNRKLTYADVAKSLAVSEQTIKRTFNGDDAPVSRLTDICRVAGVSFYDLVQMAADTPEKTFELTEEQEQYLVDMPHVYAFFWLLRAKKSVGEIRAEHGLTARATFRYLRALEKLGLIELHEGERYTMRYTGAHDYRRGGPLWRKRWTDTIMGLFTYLSDGKSRGEESIWTQSGTQMTRETLRQLRAEIVALAARYRKQSQREGDLLPKKELVDVTWVLALAAPYKEPAPKLLPDV